MQRYLSVVTEAATQDLTIAATVRDEIGAADVSDATLARWISEASDRIADYCDRVFGKETVTETFVLDPCESRQTLFLTRTPIVSIDSVTAGGSVLATTDYRFQAKTGALTRTSTRHWCGVTVEVTYSGGYDLIGTLPRSIEQACLMLIADRMSSRGRSANLKSLELPGVMTETYWVDTDGAADPLPPAVAGLVDAHRRDAI